ncbi:MAG TPA: CDP-alcohol phosphatidyltransferase family protein [Gemmatimonadota bacterium]|nr:CDP-alcohol phosphatidyltransferase family protein [Gemmatimonadota bacterium]
MREGATARKLPESARFVDLSDYARPLAVWIAGRLKNTNVVAPDVTVVWGVIGMVGAFCYGLGGYRAALIGAVAMQVKNILDAVDGSLARLQARPSRVGRFLDSIGDAAVSAALCTALAVAVARERPLVLAVALGAAALVLGLLQGSIFNYYYVRYRARRGGDTTSRVKEELTTYDRVHYEDRPFALQLLRTLLTAYNWIYGWQDRVVQRIDAWAVRPLTAAGRVDEANRLRDDHRLLTAVSVLGPGVQVLLLDLFTVAGYWNTPLMLELYLWAVALGGTLYAAVIVVRLRWSARRSVTGAGLAS